MHTKKEPVRDKALTKIFDYYRLPREEKVKFLKDQGAKDILGVLPEKVAGIFKEGFLSGLPGSEIENWNKVASYFYNNSSMIREITEDPGTFRMLEKIYTRRELVTPLDYMLYYSLSADALRNRLNAVIRFTTAYLRSKVHASTEQLLVLNLGAGTGRDTIEVCRNDPLIAEKTDIHCIDLDSEALAVGVRIASSRGLGNIRYFQKNITRLNYRKEADYGLLIGILCPLEFDHCVRLLKIMKRYFKPGAPVVAACVLDEMLKKDLFTAYILREIAGWNLCFRKPEDVQRMFEEAGYRYGGVFYDVPTRFYSIGIGLA